MVKKWYSIIYTRTYNWLLDSKSTICPCDAEPYNNWMEYHLWLNIELIFSFIEFIFYLVPDHPAEPQKKKTVLIKTIETHDGEVGQFAFHTC